MSMPRSTIRYRPMYATRQIAPVTLRSSKYQATSTHPVRRPIMLRTTIVGEWRIAFCAGMALALLFLLCGHIL